MEPTLLQPAAAAIGIIAYIIVIVGLLRANMQQSFAAFLLWAMLDLIATITTVIEHGNYWLPLSNVIGSSVITLILIVKKQVAWSFIETLTAILVVICIVVWFVAGEQAGIVASSLAVVMASIPQMVDTFKNPKATPLVAYLVFLFANTVAFMAGKAWSIEERFYPACAMFLCIVIAGFAMRR